MNDKLLYDEFIERVRSACDIVAIISDYVTLKKKGKNYWGCCPFHNEKTPSFSVDPARGFFYCFGCHAGGNVFNFVMKLENISYGETIKFLANKLNIPLPQRERTPQELAREREIAKLRDVHGLAGDFFYACLTKTRFGEQGRVYLTGRGVDEDVIHQFRLGFAPNAWDKLSGAFVKRGYGEELLVQAGLAVERDSGGIYDRFRNRVIFPICDERGRIIGFGGRVLDDSQPKYLNSPETAIFNKRRTLFGLHSACQEIRKKGYAIVVEGYMDVITAHSYGFKNTVASLGTAFTLQQCKKILRYAPEIMFAYDSDSAGQNATVRALSIARGSGADIKVISIPDGKDPDEFIRKNGAQAFQALVEKALPLVDYQVEKAFKDYDYSTLEGKVKVVSSLVPVLAQTHNAVAFNAYVARISQALGIDESAVRSEIQKFLFTQQKDKNVKKGQDIKINTMISQVDNAVVRAGRHMIKLLWDDNSIIPYLAARLELGEFSKPEHREIIGFFIECNKKAEMINEVTASLQLTQEAYAELSHCLLIEMEQADNLQEIVEDYIRTIHLSFLKGQYREHCQKADELERMGDKGFRQELAKIQQIKDEIDGL